MSISWGLQQVWNEGLGLAREKEKIGPRDYIWASELGSAYIDVFLKMKGEKPSNDFTITTLRKFDAGIIWEKTMEIVLKRIGLLKKQQKVCLFKLKEAVPVKGKLDFIAGGIIKEKKAKKELKKIKNLIPENIYKASFSIIEALRGKRLQKIVLEIKSVSSLVFEKYMSSNANLHHKLQIFHYLLSTGLNEGHIVYISKDDARILEVGVFNPSSIKEEYEKWVLEFSEYFLSNKMPPKEKEIVFNKELKKFEINWKVLYSPFLTKIYNFKDQKEMKKKFDPLVLSWNRTIKKAKNKKNLTKKDLEKIKEMKKYGFDFEKITT